MKKILQFLLLVLTCAIAAHSFGALTSQSLQYDDLNRLTGVDYGNGIAIQYNYDEAGNINPVTGAFTYTPNLNKVGADSFIFRVSERK